MKKEKNMLHPRARMKLAGLAYSIVCNIPICFCLCMTSTLVGGSKIENGQLIMNLNINWPVFWMNYGIALFLALIVANFVPLTSIGKWFTALFKVDNFTYKGNMPYRLLACVIISIIYYLVISPSLCVINFLIFRATTFGEALINLLIQMPFMLSVGYLSSLIFDFFAYRVGHAIDDKF